MKVIFSKEKSGKVDTLSEQEFQDSYAKFFTKKQIEELMSGNKSLAFREPNIGEFVFTTKLETFIKLFSL